METTRKAWRRWFGLLFLILAGAMMLWGFTILRSRLEGLAFVLYWLGCFVFASAALLVALIDLVAVRREAREQRRQLLLRTLTQVADRQRAAAGEPRLPDKRDASRGRDAGS